ncbi:hypothetical protein B8A44_07425 [Dolosigranulum pigrum]|uniref:Uncharacterized protein n=1 Tax=Dolosigranulum pigrum TaxID=29394 RepID=A0A328KQG2_9LACT|nr:hypothetical protein B8A44_07425 [Dolosigranulum pigrum]RAN65698.1 hypothetical protein B8A45_02720 [Dolosigranulum pigrum]
MFFSLMHKKVLARKILTNTKSCRTSNIYTDDYPGFMFHGYEGQLWLREARENVDKQLDFLETVID